jgi:hypothetical protein
MEPPGAVDVYHLKHIAMRWQRVAVRRVDKVCAKRGKVPRRLTQALRNKRILKVVPTVMRLDRLRVVVYPNDHRPAHVHVIGSGCEAVFNLNCPTGPVELRENYGFASRELSRKLDVLTANLGDLCRAWEHIHGIT